MLCLFGRIERINVFGIGGKMKSTSEILNKDPLYQKIKQLNLDVLRLAKDSVELAKLNKETHIIILENAINIIKTLDVYKLLEKEGHIKDLEESLEALQKTYKMLQNYEDKLINMELIIKSDGIKD